MAGDGGDGSDDGASELGDLFRVEDIAQLASDFPLAGAAASGGSGGGASGNGGALPGRQPGGVVLTEGELLRQRGEALAQLHKIYKVRPRSDSGRLSSSSTLTDCEGAGPNRDATATAGRVLHLHSERWVILFMFCMRSACWLHRGHTWSSISLPDIWAVRLAFPENHFNGLLNAFGSPCRCSKSPGRWPRSCGRGTSSSARRAAPPSRRQVGRLTASRHARSCLSCCSNASRVMHQRNKAQLATFLLPIYDAGHR